MYRNNEWTPDAEHLCTVIITITNKKTIADNIIKICIIFIVCTCTYGTTFTPRIHKSCTCTIRAEQVHVLRAKK